MNDTAYDAIIVLGQSINLDSTIVENDKARLGEVSRLYSNHAAKAIIVCGSYGYKSIEKPALTEAQAYANYLESSGVPHDAIYLESESQETLGNLLFAKTQILMKHDWRRLLIIPTYSHSTGRISYLLPKILGDGYTWKILRIGENKDPKNVEREAKSLKLTKDINDQFTDGDHEAIYKRLMKTHPAYGGSKWTIDELRKELGH